MSGVPGNVPPPAHALLLHGMAMGAWVMSSLAADLKRAGYRVRKLSYPTRPYPVEVLVERYLRPAVAACDDGAPVHIIAHSLGAILVRCLLQTGRLPPGSRVVMLGPPNRGSEVADRLRRWPLYRWLMGQVGQQLGTGPDSIVHRLRPVREEIGIIAANRSMQPWFSALIPGEDDGAVAVSSTRLAEMRDFIVVNTTHTLLLFNREVRRQVRHFLAEGRFVHPGGRVSALGEQ